MVELCYYFTFLVAWAAFGFISGPLLLFYVFGLINPVLWECDGSQMSTPWTAGGVRHYVPDLPLYVKVRLRMLLLWGQLALLCDSIKCIVVISDIGDATLIINSTGCGCQIFLSWTHEFPCYFINCALERCWRLAGDGGVQPSCHAPRTCSLLATRDLARALELWLAP